MASSSAIRFSARTVNWLHACYGVGAASGPVIMTGALATSGRWQHGYAIVGELAQLGITNGSVDVGQVYRVLRDLEAAGLVSSSWTTGSGPARRDYELTDSGYAALDAWAAVMKERARLVGEFDARYLESVAAPRR